MITSYRPHTFIFSKIWSFPRHISVIKVYFQMEIICKTVQKLTQLYAMLKPVSRPSTIVSIDIVNNLTVLIRDSQ
jgi:hypothetical protein